MGVFEENKKKRESYIEKFLRDWDVYAGEKGLHHRDDDYINYEFYGNEKYYLSDEESYLGWYLCKYRGEEYLIPEEMAENYSLEEDNCNQLILDATLLFYQSTCDLRESLDISDIIPTEFEKDGERGLRFYFRTMNQFKEIDEKTKIFDEVQAIVADLCELNGVEDEEEIYPTLYGDFYENGNCDVFYQCDHELFDSPFVYNLSSYLSEEEIGYFFDEVRKTEEWKEFEETFEKETEESLEEEFEEL